MGKCFFKKMICGILALSFVVCSLTPLAESDGGNTIVQLSDSSCWEGYPNKTETIGTDIVLYGETYAVYTGLNISDELVRFKLKPKSPNGWIGLRFRSDLPYNSPWDCKSGYMILIDGSGNIQLMRQDGKMGIIATAYLPSGTDWSGETEHQITAGAVTAADQKSVRIILKINNTTVLDYCDDDELQICKGSSVFSVYQYGEKSNSVVSVYPNGESALGGIVNKKAPKTNKEIAIDDQWFINRSSTMDSNCGVVANVEKNADSISVSGNGGVTNNYSVTASAYSFDFSMKTVEDTVSSGSNASAVVLFRKQNRNDVTGTNSFGIKFTETGNISLVTYSSGKAKVYPAYQTGLDFTQVHNVIVEVDGHLEDDNWYADVFIYIDSTSKAYKYRNNRYSPNLEPPGFFGVLNTDNNVTSVISNVKHNGQAEVYNDEEESYPLYFADVIKEGNEEFLHWEWRPDVANSTYVLITTENGKNIGKVAYPKQTFSIKNLNGEYACLYLSVYNIDGVLSEPIKVDLTKKPSDLQVNKIERIVVDNSTGGNAGFKYEESGKTFIPNGVNYVGIRYGDHSTFEPEYGLIPADYDPYKTEIMMRTLKSNGFNFVRVFIIPGNRVAENPGLGGLYDTTQGIYIPYMECFVDFLTRANKYGIYVMPTMGENEMVDNKYFKELSGNASGQSILFSTSGIEAKKKYLTYFLEYLKNKNPELLKGLFGIEMQNEFSFNSSIAPFNQLSGEYTFIDGNKYDMSNDNQRRSLANAAIKNYYSEMKKAIKAVDGKLMLCEGTFGLIAVGKDYESSYGLRAIKDVSDTRIPMTAEELLATDIDFLDMHIYRYGEKGTAKEIWEKYKVNMKFNTEKTKNLMKSKPVVMGEYAAMSKDVEESDLETGMLFAHDLRNAVMEAGFAGAAYWTIDTFEQIVVWDLMYDNGRYLPYISLLKSDGIPNSETWNSNSYLRP